MTQPLASVSVSQSFQSLLDTVFHSVPKILVFLVILVVGWIVAKVLARAIVMVLHRVRFDRFVERGVVGQSLSRSNYSASLISAACWSTAARVPGRPADRARLSWPASPASHSDSPDISPNMPPNLPKRTSRIKATTLPMRHATGPAPPSAPTGR